MVITWKIYGYNYERSQRTLIEHTTTRDAAHRGGPTNASKVSVAMFS